MLRRYLNLFKAYYSTPKGRHDIWDYLKAVLSFFIVSAIAAFILAYFIL